MSILTSPDKQDLIRKWLKMSSEHDVISYKHRIHLYLPTYLVINILWMNLINVNIIFNLIISRCWRSLYWSKHIYQIFILRTKIRIWRFSKDCIFIVFLTKMNKIIVINIFKTFIIKVLFFDIFIGLNQVYGFTLIGLLRMIQVNKCRFLKIFQISRVLHVINFATLVKNRIHILMHNVYTLPLQKLA